MASGYLLDTNVISETRKSRADSSVVAVLSAIDTLIAATAISHDLTLVTRNTRDVEATGVRFVDPWLAR